MGNSRMGHNYMGHNYIDHNYMGNSRMGHNYICNHYIGHNYVGRDYIGHNYIGHNCVCMVTGLDRRAHMRIDGMYACTHVPMYPNIYPCTCEQSKLHTPMCTPLHISALARLDGLTMLATVHNIVD